MNEAGKDCDVFKIVSLDEFPVSEAGLGSKFLKVDV